MQKCEKFIIFVLCKLSCAFILEIRMVKEKIKPLHKDQESVAEQKELILFNDDFNTFDFVIETLIEVCGHDPIQAEQCALIAHFNGKCGVQTGSFEVLKPMHDEMTDRDLTVTIS